MTKVWSSIALNKRYGNWWSSIGGAGLEIEYQNPIIGAIGGVNTFTGVPVDLSYADGGIANAHGRLGYVVSPLTSVFVEAAGNTRDWRVGYFDSNGYRIDAGLLLEQGPGARLKGEIWGGYMGQQYNGATMSSVSSFTYGIDLAAIVADNVTAVVQGSREAKEAALGLAFISGVTGVGALGASAPTCIADAAVCVSAIEFDHRRPPRLPCRAAMGPRRRRNLSAGPISRPVGIRPRRRHVQPVGVAQIFLEPERDARP